MFTLDFNSSKIDVQNNLENWFKKKQNYNANSWDIRFII